MKVERSISSEIWLDEDFLSLPNDARLLLLGIMTMVNDEGEMIADPRYLTSQILVNNGANSGNTMILIELLCESGFIELFMNSSGRSRLRLSPEWHGKRVGKIEASAYGHEWKALSAAARKRDNHQCTRCAKSKSDGRLVAHHIIPLGSGGKNELDNLATLCARCHRIVHAERGDF